MWFFSDEEHYVVTSLTIDHTTRTSRDDAALIICVADSRLAENWLSFFVGRKFDQRFRVALGGLQMFGVESCSVVIAVVIRTRLRGEVSQCSVMPIMSNIMQQAEVACG